MNEDYKRLLEEIRDTYFLLQNEMVVFASDHSVELFGYSQDELIGKPMMELLASEERERLLEQHRNRLDEKPVPQLYETAILRKDGARIPVAISAWLTHYQGLPAVAGIVTDITEYKQTKEEYRQLLEDMNDGYGVIQEGKYVFINKRFGEIFGYEPEQLLGKSIAELMMPEDRQAAMESYERVMRGEGTPAERYEGDVLRGDGKKIIVESSIKAIQYQGEPAFSIISRDVAERKLAEEAERIYAVGIENALEGIAFTDMNGAMIYFNNSACRIFGYTPAEMARLNISQLSATSAERERLENFVREKGGFYGEILGVRKNKEIFTGLLSIIIVKDDKGKPVGRMGVFTDITERKQAEEKIRESETLQRMIIDNLPQRIFLKDINSIYIDCNNDYAQDLGVTPEKIRGKTDYDFYPTELADKYREDDRRVMETGNTEELDEVYIQDNQERIVHTVKVPSKNDIGNTTGILGIFWDITERKRADEELRDAYETLRLMFECAPYGVITTDSNMNVIQANENTVNLLGFVYKDQIIGKSWLNFIPQHLHKKAKQYLSRFQSNESVIDVEYPIVKPDGSKIIVATSSGVLRDSIGNLLGLIAIIRDVTLERHLKENEQFYITETIKSLENERKRLARALHDDTIQEIMFATYRLQDVITGNCGSLPKSAYSSLQDIQLLLKKIAVEVRSFTTNLRPDILDDMGLVSALEWLTDRLRNESGVEARLNIRGNERRLPDETELTLFRIVQEALNNVRKHASASVTMLSMTFGANKVTMSISDNGQGFKLPDNISHYARQQKLGLIGIAERVHLVGGTYEVQSSPGQGTVIKVEINE